MPVWIKDKKACTDIQNDDNRCFMSAVQCGVYEIYRKQHPERKSHYHDDRFKKEVPAIKYVNFEYCNFHMEIDDDESSSIDSKDITVVEYH